jgi:hypothetical protein
MNRLERLLLHKKQEKMVIRDGKPLTEELIEGEPTLRLTEEGLVEYVRFRNKLYKKKYDIDDSSKAYNPVAFSTYRNSNQSISATTAETTIQFNKINFDTHKGVNNSSSNTIKQPHTYAYNFQEEGLYYIYSQITTDDIIKDKRVYSSLEHVTGTSSDSSYNIGNFGQGSMKFTGSWHVSNVTDNMHTVMITNALITARVGDGIRALIESPGDGNYTIQGQSSEGIYSHMSGFKIN